MTVNEVPLINVPLSLERDTLTVGLNEESGPRRSRLYA
jgi:hypothetical protein